MTMETKVDSTPGTRAAGSIVLDCYDDTEDTHLLADPASWHFAGFGAQY